MKNLAGFTHSSSIKGHIHLNDTFMPFSYTYRLNPDFLSYFLFLCYYCRKILLSTRAINWALFFHRIINGCSCLSSHAAISIRISIRNLNKCYHIGAEPLLFGWRHFIHAAHKLVGRMNTMKIHPKYILRPCTRYH